MINQRKHVLSNNKARTNALSANTAEKPNVIKEHKKDTMQKAMNDCPKNSFIQDEWPSILKQHLKMLESHINFLEKSMKRAKNTKPNELLQSELEDAKSWSKIYQVMDAAMESLRKSRVAAIGILPVHKPFTKKELDRKANKSLGVEALDQWDKDTASLNTQDEILEPELSKKGTSADAEDSSDSSAQLVPPHIDMKKLCLSRKSKKPKVETSHKRCTDGAQKYTQATKMNMNGFTKDSSNNSVQEANYTFSSKKKIKRVQLVEPDRRFEFNGAAGPQNDPTATVSIIEPIEKDIDFAAIQIRLQEEIAAGERAAKEARGSTSYTASPSLVNLNSRKKKRRRRSSDDLNQVRHVGKKIRSEKIERAYKDKKRKADEIEVNKEMNDSKRKKILKILKKDSLPHD
ncbi:hypothetical protein EV44_g4724 [Erysiphe necator]|uniref:Uncharacterized protein n=1 Tax=Uncinula necator TaxID=52586 RepID=A0A0B1PD84_UNCNE|nr:hypothetical protein EV44_g4724 [Erysiphe necator]